MGKISHDQLVKEVNAKGYVLVDDSNYKNLKSPIVVRCLKGHEIETNLESFRHISFSCPICEGAVEFKKPTHVPQKEGYRIVAFDQATEKCGVSIWDAGKLVYCDLFIFTGDMVSRLCKFKSLLEDIIIPNWEPDFLVFEDIQYQNNIMTFKILAMLLGVAQTAARSKGIEFDVVLPKVWRSGLGYSGKNRAEEKALAKQKVKEWFNIDANEDMAEAILIGKYAAKFHKSSRAF